MDHKIMVRKKQRPTYFTEDSLFDIHSYDIDLNANHIYLFGREEYISCDMDGVEPGIEFAIANKFIRNLNTLVRKSDEPILIHMKTNGGDWQEGMAIYDTIRACPNQVCILNYTHARSMSSIIFQAADKRIMMPNSIFLFHDGTMAMDGTTKQFLTEAEELKKTMEIMNKIYVQSMRKSGKWESHTDEEIEMWLRKEMDKKEDVYLNATEAVQRGFADGVFENWDDLLKF